MARRPDTLPKKPGRTWGMTETDLSAAIPIALLLIVLLGIWLGVAGPLVRDVDTQGWYGVLKDWQTLIIGLPTIGVAIAAAVTAWLSVQGQIAHQQRALTMTIATREEDRIEGLLPGLERASAFLLGLSLELHALTHLENAMDTLQLHGVATELGTEADIQAVLPDATAMTRDQVVRVLNHVRDRAEAVRAAFDELSRAELTLVMIHDWDPSEHDAIRAAPDAYRQQKSVAETRLRAAIEELDERERDMTDQAASYRRRLRSLRQQIEEALEAM